MKITVRVNEFKRVLEEARFVAPKKSAMPVLTHVKVEVNDAKQATLSAQDFGMCLLQPFEVVDGDAGSFLLPLKQTLDFLKRHVGGTASIEATPDEKHVIITAGTFTMKFPTEKALHFPTIWAMPEATIADISLKFLNKLLTQVELACPDVAGKRTVPSVQIESDGKLLRAVASDGFRIAIADAPCDCGVFTFQLPKSLLQIVKRRRGAMFQFAQSETNTFLRTESVVFQFRIPTTKFPEYGKAAAFSEFKGTIRVAGADLKAAILNLGSTTDLENPQVLFKVSGSNLQLTALTLDKYGTEIAAGSGSLEVETEGEQDLTVKLNPNFVLDFLSRAEGDVAMQLVNGTTKVKLTDETIGYQHLIMPCLPDKPKAVSQTQAESS